MIFYRFPKTQWKWLRTTNAIEGLHGEFRRRVKRQGSLPNAQPAELLLFGPLISDQILMWRIDGQRQLDQLPDHLTQEAALGGYSAVGRFGDHQLQSSCEGHLKRLDTERSQFPRPS